MVTTLYVPNTFVKVSDCFSKEFNYGLPEWPDPDVMSESGMTKLRFVDFLTMSVSAVPSVDYTFKALAVILYL